MFSHFWFLGKRGQVFQREQFLFWEPFLFGTRLASCQRKIRKPLFVRKPPFVFWLMMGLCGLALSAGQAASEMRGAWISSAYNLDFPSRSNMTAAEQRQEIRQLMTVAAQCRLNNVFVQVRPEGDALYCSAIEPWSRFLTGKQGKSPGFDPLQAFIDEGKRRGIAIHAWINPYRAAVNARNICDKRHISRSMASSVRRVGRLLWMDPSSPAVQQHVLMVVKDLISRYNLAGIHLDDYFYPYPDQSGGRSFPDAIEYSAYRAAGGQLGLGDWRRRNVNMMVYKISMLIHQRRPRMKFGISPFGIYTKGHPASVMAGIDQLNQLYSDPIYWMRQGWVDYIAPQLYWKDGGEQSFSTLLNWWRNPAINPRRIPVYPGISLERLSEGKWAASEIAHQLRLERSIQPRYGGGGFILWRIHQLVKNTKGVAPIVARE